jgi:hypothetical protein
MRQQLRRSISSGNVLIAVHFHIRSPRDVPGEVAPMFDWDPRIGALMHREPVLAKVVAAPAGPADAQVKGSDGWTVMTVNRRP